MLFSARQRALSLHIAFIKGLVSVVSRAFCFFGLTILPRGSPAGREIETVAAVAKNCSARGRRLPSLPIPPQALPPPPPPTLGELYFMKALISLRLKNVYQLAPRERFSSRMIRDVRVYKQRERTLALSLSLRVLL